MNLRKSAIGLLAAVALVNGTACGEVLSLPENQRPEWLSRDGIVMAGSWEALPFRVRRDGIDGYTPTPAQQEAWDHEHSRDMLERLKALGVNFVMAHGYKGLGVTAEKQSMADAVVFARLCHEAGMRVGVYTYSGAFLWEPFFREAPQAKDWVLLDERNKPITYGRTDYRYFWNRNHPDAVRFYRELVRFAVQDIKTDLIHFDNYHESAGFDAQSVKDFRRYLRSTFSTDDLRKAGIDPDTAMPPRRADPPDLLKHAWRDFECGYLARSYLDMSRYARSLRGDILMECNPMSVQPLIRPPVDHSRILPGGEAFWDESSPSGIDPKGKLHTRIRTYKVGRLMNNLAFSYVMTPLEAAESMAFNHPDCFGCICWFEYGNIVAKPGWKTPPAAHLQPYIRFFQARRDLLRGAEVVADVAILRSFPSQAFADQKYAAMTAAVEDACIAGRTPFQIVYDRHLGDLKRWPILLLAGCVAMSDTQVQAVKRFAADGGKICIIGDLATHDEWMSPRDRAALADLPASAVARVADGEEAVSAIRRLAGGSMSLEIETRAPICAEVVRQPARRLVHLVNYDPREPVADLPVRLRVPPARRPIHVRVADPLQPEDIEIPFEFEAETVRFRVPRLSVYAVGIVDFQ